MKASELTQVNIGDTIAVRGVVQQVEGGIHPVVFKLNNGENCWLFKATEVEIVERAFKKGDEVYRDGDQCIILCIDGEEAWVRRYCDFARFTVKTSALKRVAS